LVFLTQLSKEKNKKNVAQRQTNAIHRDGINNNARTHSGRHTQSTPGTRETPTAPYKTRRKLTIETKPGIEAGPYRKATRLTGLNDRDRGENHIEKKTDDMLSLRQKFTG